MPLFLFYNLFKKPKTLKKNKTLKLIKQMVSNCIFFNKYGII